MNNELNIKVSATLKDAINNLDKLKEKLMGTDKAWNSFSVSLNKNGELSSMRATIKNIDKQAGETTSSLGKMKNAFSLGSTFLMARKGFRTLFDMSKQASDYSESLNLFNVVLHNTGKELEGVGLKGTKFQNQMNEAFGTNISETMTYQGLYQSMAENMGIASDRAYIMSETTTKLINDISSLYNKDEKVVAEALRAGVYAGQTKPLRSFGMDVTQQSLQPIVNDLGIKNDDGTEKTVRNFSQAEKQILRYIAVLRQSSVAHADWANTIESPANQLKIFKDQCVEAKRALGSLFIGTFSKILPYANAIVMVVKEVATAIATMFGIELQDYNTSIGSVEDYGDSYEDVADAVENTKNKVKELQRATLGFDQINNISENKDNGSGSSGGGGTIGGIDQRLLDAITGYDNKMADIKMKATEIRDKIMDWLGFTKEIDPLTGKVSFKLRDGLTNIKKIGIAVAGIIGFGILNKIVKVASAIGTTTKATQTLMSAIGTTGLLKVFKNLIEYTKIYTSLAKGNLLKGIKGGTQAWISQNATMLKGVGIIAMVVAGWTSFTKQYKKNAEFKKSVDGIGTSIKDLSILITPLSILIDGLTGYIKKLGGSFTTVIDSTVNNFASTIALPFNMLNNLIHLDFKGALDTATEYAGNFLNNMKNTGTAFLNVLPFVHIETEAEKFAKKMKEIEKNLFNNGGTSIIVYKESLDKLLSSIVNAIPNVSKYNDVIKENSDKYKTAEESLSILLTQMSTDAYKVTSNDISKLNDILQTMTDSVKESGQAFTDATTLIVNHLVEEGRMSEEQALRVVKASQLKANAENDRVEQYRLRMLELTHQLESGTITQEQFTKSQIEATKEYNNTSKTIDVAKNSIKNYVDYINSDKLITTKNWNELNTTISQIGTTFADNKKKVQENFESEKKLLENSQLYWQKQIDTQNRVLENLKRTKGEESVEYQNAKLVLDDYQNKYNDATDTIKKLNASQKGSIKDLKQTTVEAVLGIVSSLKSSNYSMKQDSEGTVKEINKILKKLGIKDEVDLNQNMDGIIKQINDKLGTKIPKTVTEANKSISKVGQGIEGQVANNGASIGAVLGKNISDNIKINGNTLNRTWNNATQSLQSKLSSLVNSGLSMFGINLKIPGFADGKFDIPEDGWFRASKGELMGKFDDGTSVVANNNQIIDGIRAGVYEAVSLAMAQYNGQPTHTSIELYAHTDEGVIIDRINEKTIQTGECPIKVV